MLLAVLLALGATTSPVPIGLRVTTPQYDGVIVAPRLMGTWMPTPADVAECERALAQFFRRNARTSGRIAKELPRYKRHYAGIVRGGHRVLIVAGFHDSQKPANTNAWLDRLWAVSGGGDFFFRAEYDFATKSVRGGPNAPK
jgi:hypothetical protein